MNDDIEKIIKDGLYRFKQDFELKHVPADTTGFEKWLRQALHQAQQSERRRALTILEEEIALAHTHPAGKTSRLTSAYMRIKDRNTGNHWRCGKCDGGNLPEHSPHCQLRNTIS